MQLGHKSTRTDTLYRNAPTWSKALHPNPRETPGIKFCTVHLYTALTLLGPRVKICNVRIMFKKIPVFLSMTAPPGRPPGCRRGDADCDFVNGRHMTTAILSPARFEDFITGYLYTEEIIRDVDEIESVRIEENRISVLTRNLFKRVSTKKTILSGCGGAVSYIDTEKLPTINSDLIISSPRSGAVAALARCPHSCRQDRGSRPRCRWQHHCQI